MNNATQTALRTIASRIAVATTRYNEHREITRSSRGSRAALLSSERLHGYAAAVHVLRCLLIQTSGITDADIRELRDGARDLSTLTTCNRALDCEPVARVSCALLIADAA